MRTLTTTLLLLLTAAGCATVPLGSAAADRSAKSFTPSAGKAGLYVYRPSRFVLSALAVSVQLDGRALGMTKAGTYLHTELAPGGHTVLSLGEDASPVVVDVQAGKNYFFHQEVAFGSQAARTSLLPVDEATGREAVLDSRLAATHPPAK